MSSPALVLPRTLLAGTYAAGLLEGAPGVLTVLGGGSSAVYLEHESAGIIWLGANHTPLHRRAVLLSGLPRLGTGVRLRSGYGELCLGDDVLSRLDGSARRWEAAPPAPLRVPRGEAIRRLRTLARDRQALPASLGAQIAALLCGVGSGPGLTPAGDDVAGGFLFALCTLAAAGLAGPRQALRDARRALPSLAHETHPISFTLLSDLAAGHGPAPLHNLAEEIFSARHGPRAETVGAVLAIGHSSGAELLAGFAAGALAGLESEEE